LEEIFGPVSAFFVPAEADDAIEEFRRGPNGLERASLTRDEFLRRC
jgi:acyl-CoA reductase-like NAD-dependent aldehyde dehydrogenase